MEDRIDDYKAEHPQPSETRKWISYVPNAHH